MFKNNTIYTLPGNEGPVLEAARESTSSHYDRTTYCFRMAILTKGHSFIFLM